jgi:3-hydroxyisobutyrate dehydrogenase-like beta-hydroxyacid dehydrogenase
MARRIQEAGWPLVVYNRDIGATKPFAEKGIKVAGNPREVAASSDIVFSMVTDDQAVRNIAFGRDGIFAGLREDKIYADITTASSELALELQSAATGIGAKTLDVKVSGSIEPAEKGELLILVGGDSQAIERVRPVLEVLGRKIIRTGSHGTASLIKIAINVLLDLQMEALSEALVITQKAEIATDVIAEAINSSGMSSPFIKGKLQTIQNQDYRSQFALRLAQKDLELALDESKRLMAPIPATAATNEVAKSALAAGLGDKDMSALYLLITSLAGTVAEPIKSKTMKEPAQSM